MGNGNIYFRNLPKPEHLDNMNKYYGWVRFLVFNTTFNNISVISWLSVLSMEETGVPREDH